MNKNTALALTQLDGLIAGIEMGSSIPVQLAELKMLKTLLTTPDNSIVFPQLGNTEIKPEPIPLYPSLASLQSVVDMAKSQLPIESENAIIGLLLTYHNTLLKAVKNSTKQ